MRKGDLFTQGKTKNIEGVGRVGRRRERRMTVGGGLAQPHEIIEKYMHTYVNTYICTYKYTCICSLLNICVPTYMQTCMETSTCTYLWT